MTGPAVALTVVIATHRRPDALRAAVSSVLGQTREDWRLLVLGDGCGARTRAVMAEVQDARIEYIDLPARFGEQSGPNSIGMALAETPFIAFLNHDDLWLPDHVEHALAALESGRGDFFIGKSAVAYSCHKPTDGELRPDFSLLRPVSHDPWDAVNGDVVDFEPCSAWVLSRDLARRVGAWQRPRELIRTPLVDWFLRALRARARCVFSDTLTVLGMTTHIAPGRDGSYAHASPEHAYAARWIRETPPETVRAAVLENVARHPTPERRGLGTKRWQRHVSRPLRRLLYRTLGVDLYTITRRSKGRVPGERMERITRGRTGSGLHEDVSIEAALELVRAQRERDPEPDSSVRY